MSGENDKDDLLTQALELFMLRLRYKQARLIRAGSNSPILLTDQQTAWVVYTGQIDVFLVPVDAAHGCVTGTRRHLFRAQAGQALFGVGWDDCGAITLVAVGGPDTQLLRVERSALEKLAEESSFADLIISMVDHWLTGISEGMVRQAPPQGITVLEPGSEIHLSQGQSAQSNRGILWVRHLEGQSRLIGVPDLPLMANGFLPLSNRTWVESSGASTLCAITTQALISQDPAWSALDHFHRLALTCFNRAAAQAEQSERERWQRKAAADQRQVATAFAHLALVLEPKAAIPFGDESGDADPLLAACRWVGQAMGVTIQPPPGAPGERGGQNALRKIASASRVRIRQVTLQGTWWREDCGPILAYLAPDPSHSQTQERPVALLPSSGRYDLLDPVAKTRTRVTAEVATLLSPVAFAFYPPLPPQPLTGLDLIKHGLRGRLRDVLAVVLSGIGMGSLGLITPLMIGVLFDAIIPSAQMGQLLQLGLALLVSALAAALFQLTRNIAVLRLESKLDTSVQAALWDRLLRLPVPFFRQYAAGDLAERVLGINAIRQNVSGAVVSSVLSGLFSVMSLGLLFYYAPGLAWSAIGLALISILVTAGLGYWQVRYQRDWTDAQGRVSGLVLQLVTGITKLRMAGAEGRAFARWANAFGRQRAVAFKARTVTNELQVFNTAYPVLTLLTIFALLARGGQAQLSTGAFLAFNAAFTQFLVASLAVSQLALTAILSTIPLYERIKPVLQAVPEVDPAQADPGVLTGEVEISHVAFRYRENEPLVLRDVSLHIKPGEFVAVVGSSGCGKSTLLRLLLKFETPLAGAIYYDGQDLERLDIETVRRQIGVVLQDGKLIAGSILSNIIGSSLLTIDDAWEAARMVGLEQDIEQMPMGMHTALSEGGTNLSGGQRQRLLIARAIVNKPRLLFLDEATSALDNPNQALVSASLERLSATRVVIAHRLSTIVNAGRIYVFDQGQVVQSGDYAELMRQRGLFAELARRQLM